ncbi:hypothetical protein [Roseitranquillus sediminis]|uniref:hypothetical protein n=1 Tax=Roseitranquillus sediminis TaxID=2809051 RepID=UPI001D0CAB5A|nr:hypothetical protein [Roseitranquillus sediminis]MBM9596189.1 hypothetical protein [Roseitranquillus sediminis]
MRILLTTALVSSALALAACGNTATERAATGGVAGAVVGGPIGAVAGGTVGAATTR